MIYQVALTQTQGVWLCPDSEGLSQPYSILHVLLLFLHDTTYLITIFFKILQANTMSEGFGEGATNARFSRLLQTTAL